MNGSNSPIHDNVDLSSLSKEDLLRVITEQKRAIKTKDEAINAYSLTIKAQKHEIKTKEQELITKEREIKERDKIIAQRGKAIDNLIDDGKRLICIGKIMNEGLSALKEHYAASDKYVILLNDMLSRDTVTKA